jgi:hypothetical protein
MILNCALLSLGCGNVLLHNDLLLCINLGGRNGSVCIEVPDPSLDGSGWETTRGHDGNECGARKNAHSPGTARGANCRRLLTT